MTLTQQNMMQLIPATSVAHRSAALARMRFGTTTSLSTLLRVVLFGSPCHRKHRIAITIKCDNPPLVLSHTHTHTHTQMHSCND